MSKKQLNLNKKGNFNSIYHLPMKSSGVQLEIACIWNAKYFILENERDLSQ